MSFARLERGRNPLGVPSYAIAPQSDMESRTERGRSCEEMRYEAARLHFFVDNRAGASGSIGTGSVAKSLSDGSTWLFVFDNRAANPFVLPTLPYDTEKDLDPVLLIGTPTLRDHNLSRAGCLERSPTSSLVPSGRPRRSAMHRSAFKSSRGARREASSRNTAGRSQSWRAAGAAQIRRRTDAYLGSRRSRKQHRG